MDLFVVLGLIVVVVVILYVRRPRRAESTRPVSRTYVTSAAQAKVQADAEQAIIELREARTQLSAQATKTSAAIADIQRRAGQQQTRASFDRAVAAHRMSYQIADQAHAKYTTAREKKRALTRAIDASGAPNNPAIIHLKSIRGRLNGEIESGLNDVRELNARTHRLKIAIRDGFGKQGQDWYLRRPWNK